MYEFRFWSDEERTILCWFRCKSLHILNEVLALFIESYPFQHPHNVSGVIEGSNLLMTFPIHNGHSLQTHTLHLHLGGEEEAMVEVIEEFIPVNHTTCNK